MTTPVGQIGLSDVNAELDLSPTALITMNDADVRTLAGVGGSGTVISMNDLRGKSNRVALSITITGNTTNYNVYTAASSQPTYDAGKTDLTLTINPGVIVYSTSTGSSALSVPSSFNPADTVTIVNNGTILGAGGGGGTGVYYGSGYNTNGSPGGPALYVARPVTFTNNNRIAGGGGGGAGGLGSVSYIGPDTGYWQGGGGGGGGGIGNGGGGGGGQTYPPGTAPNGTPGQSGTLTSAGNGGTNAPFAGTGYPNQGQPVLGGAGGTYGASGSNTPPSPWFGPIFIKSGGAAGAAVSGDPYITWPATGTRNGPIS